jgi:hypothetical protein
MNLNIGSVNGARGAFAQSAGTPRFFAATLAATFGAL